MDNRVQNNKLIKFICFVVVLLVSTFWGLMFWDPSLYGTGIGYDADYYWNIANSSHLDLLPNTFRGYLLPYLIFATKTISVSLGLADHVVFIIAISLLCALFLTILLPAVAMGGIQRSRELPIKRYLFGTSIALFLTLFFWTDFIICPLSDFPALVFCTASIYLLILLYETTIQDKKGNNQSNYVKIIKLLLIAIMAGGFAYAAYNLRAIYLYGLIIAAIIWIIKNRNSNKKLLLLSLIGLALGILIVAYPQMHVNKMYLGTYSPKVPTESYGVDLKNAQLAGGLTVDRFESFAGIDSVQTNPAMLFEDEVGTHITQVEGIGSGVGVKQLIHLFIKYPLDMAGVYSRHVINYLTPVWNQAYIKDLRIDNTIFMVPAILLWLLAGYCIMQYSRQDYKKWLIDEAWIQLPFIILCLFMIPGAAEMRFFISGYFLMYGFLCYRVDYRKIYTQSFKKHPIKISLIMLIVFLMWISIIAAR